MTFNTSTIDTVIRGDGNIGIGEADRRVTQHGAGVEGHTDSTGSDTYNMQLSDRRAAAVKAQFVNDGLLAAEVRAVGKGETQPIASNDTEESRAQNRRVVIIVTPADAN